MNSICVSVDTAKKLKEAGWTKLTKIVSIATQKSNLWRPILSEGMDLSIYSEWYYVPTAEEILRELPNRIKFIYGQSGWQYLEIYKADDDLYVFKYADYLHRNVKVGGISKSLSEAAAQMWLFMKKGGYIK